MRIHDPIIRMEVGVKQVQAELSGFTTHQTLTTARPQGFMSGVRM